VKFQRPNFLTGQNVLMVMAASKYAFQFQFRKVQVIVLKKWKQLSKSGLVNFGLKRNIFLSV